MPRSRRRPLQATLEDSRLRLGRRLTVGFQRTLRLPDLEHDRNYPLPPGLGPFPLQRAVDFPARAPEAWVTGDEFFLPMYRREAMWIGFDAAPWKPNAVKVGIGGVNVVSGEALDDRLRTSPQDYLVVPDQPWIDGIKTGTGVVRQFVAVPLGENLSVEGQISGRETVGGIQLSAFEPASGRFPDGPPPVDRSFASSMMSHVAEAPVDGAMGLGAGGRLRQRVYPDRYGVGTWEPDPHCSAVVHIVDVARYGAITGFAPPATPVSARTYTEYGLPWFDLYEEDANDIATSTTLASVRSVAEMEGRSGGASEASLDVPEDQVVRLTRGRRARGGKGS
jgi:hypothetical protein